MAPAANPEVSAASDSLEAVSKPPPGIVLPPRDIRIIVEKTTGFVARNGTAFEERIREKEKHNPKFSFLSANDAYYPFYAWRLTEVREGRGTAISAGRAGEAAPAPEPEKPKGPVEPPAFHFSARMPNINAQDLEVVKLTALFVAKNGRSFMTALSQRETRNYQFDFLRPQHSLYQFFSRLVDQYTELLQASSVDGGKAERARIEELQSNAKDRFHVLGRAKQRAEWVKFQEEQKQKKEEAAEKENLEYAQIDWHDFVVVETVLFTEADDQADLPGPTSLNDLQSASLEQKAMMSLQPHNMRIEEAMPTDEDPYYNPYAPQQQYQPQQQQQYAMQPPPLPSSYPQTSSSAPTSMKMDLDPQHNPPPGRTDDDASYEAHQIAERTEARDRAQAAQAAAKATFPAGQPLRIRNDYVPRAQAASKRASTSTMALCPNCKQQIPYDELEMHMRIELLDPTYRAQRAKADSRAATTNLSTSDVAANLKRLASQRTDVFDASVTGASTTNTNTNALSASSSSGAAGELGGADEEEGARRKRVALGTGGMGEGMGGGGGGGGGAKAIGKGLGEGISIEEQIRVIHQKAKQ